MATRQIIALLAYIAKYFPGGVQTLSLGGQMRESMVVPARWTPGLTYPARPTDRLNLDSLFAGIV